MKQRISPNMSIDKRTNARIEVKSINLTNLTLRYNNLELKLSHVEAVRIGELLRTTTDRQREARDL